jgi:hypothetical protein
LGPFQDFSSRLINRANIWRQVCCDVKYLMLAHYTRGERPQRIPEYGHPTSPCRGARASRSTSVPRAVSFIRPKSFVASRVDMVFVIEFGNPCMY